MNATNKETVSTGIAYAMLGRLGWNPSIATPGLSYDLLAEKNGVIKRIQVKWYDEASSFVKVTKGSGEPYGPNDFDVCLIVGSKHHRVWAAERSRIGPSGASITKFAKLDYTSLPDEEKVKEAGLK